jgi:small subunit ribosomal protein S9
MVAKKDKTIKKKVEEKKVAKNVKSDKPATKKNVKKEPKKVKVDKIIFTVGKRKRAIARANFKKGKGIIKINSTPLELMQPEIIRLKIKETLMIAGDAYKGFDAKVNVKGGGMMGQAEAVRMALARGFVKLLGEELKQRYLKYDRNLLVYDPRRTEPHKPPRSSQGPRRYKQRSKR